MSKKLAVFLGGITATAFVTAAFAAAFPFVAPRNSTSLTSVPVQQGSATNTASELIPAYTVIDLTGQDPRQGTCLKLRDNDGGGYTYLTTFRGVGNFSQVDCTK